LPEDRRMKHLSVIGLNYRTAPLAAREQFALPGDLVARLLQTFHREDVLDEALVLDTCNRTEFYFLEGCAGRDPHAYLLERLSHLKGAAIQVDASLLYRHEGLEAVRHLFRVAASLESQIVGEHQVLGQVKLAYRLAVEARTAKFLLNKVCHWAIRVGKRVRTETDLGRGNASVSQAAVSLARQVFGNLSGVTVLLVGAGENAETAARALMLAGVTHLIVANRTLNRAQDLADKLMSGPDKPAAETETDHEDVTGPAAMRRRPEGDLRNGAATRGADALSIQAITLEGVPRFLDRIDLILSSTGATHAVLTWEQVAEPLRRAGRSVLMIDVAVPRDVDPRLAQLPNVYLYNIDELSSIVADDLRQRQQEVPRAEAIVEAEVRDFATWLGTLQVAPTIQQLYGHLAVLQAQQLDHYGKNFDRADRQQLEQFTDALCRRLLHQPVEFLKEVSQNGSTSEPLAAIDLVRRMFGLNAQER